MFTTWHMHMCMCMCMCMCMSTAVLYMLHAHCRLEDSKLGMSRVAPYVRRHPGLAGGFAGGFLLAYRLV